MQTKQRLDVPLSLKSVSDSGKQKDNANADETTS
ncbi:phage pro-head protease [Escherichia coli]|nr:phage pro-head protease [Escherichia coli]CAD6028026.1 pro-head protease [Escherichia coli]CAD6128559.1 pro-head protease [Escherichia coli]